LLIWANLFSDRIDEHNLPSFGNCVIVAVYLCLALELHILFVVGPIIVQSEQTLSVYTRLFRVSKPHWLSEKFSLAIVEQFNPLLVS